MSYDNSFLKELDKLDPKNVGSELPKTIYEYIAKKVVDEATRQCNSLMASLKKEVSNGNFKLLNGKRTVTVRTGLSNNCLMTIRPGFPTSFVSNKEAKANQEASMIYDYLKDVSNTKTIKDNFIEKSYEDMYRVIMLGLKIEMDIKKTFWGNYKRVISYKVQSVPFTDLYIDTINSILKRNGLETKIFFELSEKAFSSSSYSVVKKYEITKNFSPIYDTYETPSADNKCRAYDLSCGFLVEVTAKF